MRHHFTNSERLALAVYRALENGGVIHADFTDVGSSTISISEKPKNIDGWGRVERTLSRTITFMISQAFPNEPIALRVTLLGFETTPNASSPRIGWRLHRVEKIYEGPGGPEYEKINVPSFERIMERQSAARQELEVCEALERLRNLMEHSPYTAEPEPDHNN